MPMSTSHCTLFLMHVVHYGQNMPYGKHSFLFLSPMEFRNSLKRRKGLWGFYLDNRKQKPKSSIAIISERYRGWIWNYLEGSQHVVKWKKMSLQNNMKSLILSYENTCIIFIYLFNTRLEKKAGKYASKCQQLLPQLGRTREEALW